MPWRLLKDYQAPVFVSDGSRPRLRGYDGDADRKLVSHTSDIAGREGTPMAQPNYDLVIIGSGPAGQKAAFCAAKLGRQVALIERVGCVGGACIQSGTIPSKAMR